MSANSLHQIRPPSIAGEGKVAETAAPAIAPSTAAEGLDALLDAGSFREVRSQSGDGVTAGSGTVEGRPVCVWAQDIRHRGGSLSPAGGETILRTLQRANRTGVPVVGLPQSGGARLQEGVAALSAYGAIFREQARSRVPQINVICGVCAGGAAYSPALGDFVVLSGAAPQLFLTGPKIVEKVTRERIGADELGGRSVHERNGIAHLSAPDDRGAAELVRQLLAYLPSTVGGRPPRAAPRDAPPGNPADHLPPSMRQVYDVRDVIANVVDGGRHLELAPRWARNMVTTLARVDGRPVGVLANQPRYLGGTIDAEASDKGAWFVELCDRFALPMVVLVDTPGFLPGRNQERRGVIRRGAALLRAFGRAQMPKVTVTLRQAYGGAHIVMSSRDLSADVTLAWPSVLMGIMGARQAVEIVDHRAVAAGGDVEELAERYAATKLQVDVAATAGFVDEIIAPEQTRERLVEALALHD